MVETWGTFAEKWLNSGRFCARQDPSVAADVSPPTYLRLHCITLARYKLLRETSQYACRLHETKTTYRVDASSAYRAR